MMNILDFFKYGSNVIKNSINDNDLVKNELLSKHYNRAYLFHGNYDKTIVVDGQLITYSHSECFLANNKQPYLISKCIRLTGDKIDGNPLPIIKREHSLPSKSTIPFLHIEDNGIKYKISNSTCLDEFWLNNHYISGFDIINVTDSYNLFKIKKELNKNVKQNASYDIFEK